MSKFFLDIGANTGQTFDWLATQPHDYRDHIFFLFEPSPRHFAALIEKIKEQKRKGYQQINLCPFGVGDSDEVRVLFEKDDRRGDSFAFQTASDHETKNARGGYSVIAASVSLSSFIYKVTRPGDQIVLDIDAEGSEYEILDDLLTEDNTRSRVVRLIVEFHFVQGIDAAARKAYFVERFASHGITIECRGSVP